MELKFSSPVNRHYFALRCVPGDSLRQKIRLEECRVEPADYLREIRDGFGNRKLTGCCGRPHDFFRYRIRGTAQIDNGSGDRTPLHPISGPPPPRLWRWERECARTTPIL